MVAAGERRLEPLVEGMIIIASPIEGLCGAARDRISDAGQACRCPNRGWRMVKPYQYLNRIGSPLSLIQSTNDEYVPAATAGRWFGPDTTLRRFHPIRSRNHSFSDARDALLPDDARLDRMGDPRLARVDCRPDAVMRPVIALLATMVAVCAGDSVWVVSGETVLVTVRGRSVP